MERDRRDTECLRLFGVPWTDASWEERRAVISAADAAARMRDAKAAAASTAASSPDASRQAVKDETCMPQRTPPAAD
jgi:hypothetical protein